VTRVSGPPRLIGGYQVRNAGLAVAAGERLAGFESCP
jgi:hypothetical protein